MHLLGYDVGMTSETIYAKQSGHTAPRLFGCDAWNQVLPMRRI